MIDMKRDILIAVGRSLAGFEAVLSRFKAECEIASVPLSEIGASSSPKVKPLVESWAALADEDRIGKQLYYKE